MIDTIILEMPISHTDIINRKEFNPEIPETGSWFSNPSGFRYFKNNPTKEDKSRWGYLPRLTILQRGFIHYLKIEFSAPKILFEDNVNEVKENDFENVVNKLRIGIDKMGISVNNEQIINANVSGFHLSKNIILKNCYDSILAISELQKVDISRKLDIDIKEFRNGGAILQFYTNQHAFVLYDKVRDLKKPPKRAVDKDQTAKHKTLFNEISGKVEILRLEARIKAKKISYVFEKINYQNNNPTFKDIFNKDLCQKILKYYWDYFFKDNLFLFDMRNSPQSILKIILDKQKGKKINIHKVIELAGFVFCCKDEKGMTMVRNLIESSNPKNNWSKTKKWLENFNKELNKTYLHGFIRDIESQLDKFEPFRVE